MTNIQGPFGKFIAGSCFINMTGTTQATATPITAHYAYVIGGVPGGGIALPTIAQPGETYLI